MKVVVKERGNSASVRIPASVMAAAALSLDQAVDVREEAGRIVIEPIRGVLSVDHADQGLSVRGASRQQIGQRRALRSGQEFRLACTSGRPQGQGHGLGIAAGQGETARADC
jgi:antitoxin component of MazEF toxin-antitoxin module